MKIQQTDIANCPENYELNSGGVYSTGKRATRIAGPIWPTARVVDEWGAWGLEVAFIDYRGHKQRLTIPAAALHGTAKRFAAALATRGLNTVPGQESALLRYLAAWQPVKIKPLPDGHRHWRTTQQATSTI
jgi:hypothetical protein